MQALIKPFLLVFYVLYVLVAFVWPSVRTYKKTGINPMVFQNNDDAHSYVGKWFKILMVLAFVAIVIRAFFEPWAYLLNPIAYLEQPSLQMIGVGLCVASLVWTSIAQLQMGTSWRIGIDQEHKTELKSKGLFAMSRNPIFLGMITTLLGYFLLIPSAVTLVVVVVGFVLIQIQILLEEEFLAAQHGEQYERYRHKVPRRLI